MPSPNNTESVEVKGLRNAITNEIINDADVTLIVYDSSDVIMTGDTFPKTLGYVTDSKGVYRTTLSPTIPWTVGETYKYVFTVLSTGLKLTTVCYKTATESSCGC
jgi:hypothetical protein